MRIYGKEYTRDQLLERIGNITQLGGTRHYELCEGKAKGVRAVDVDTGSGLKFTILPDRGMDVSLAKCGDVNLSYMNCADEVNPAYYDSRELGWLHSFYAGLLTTCGLSSFGAPCDEAGEHYGLHGRYSSTPACKVNDTSHWEGDDYLVEISGVVEEARLFGPKVRLKRTISTMLGSRTIRIEDEAENFGFSPAPFMILYHINIGFPLVDADSELSVTAEAPRARDEIAAAGLAEAKVFSSPQQDFSEQVFLYNMKPADDGRACAALANRNLKGGMGICVKFDSDQLPYLTEWKMMGRGEYVVGIEPCNCPGVFDSRDTMREGGTLPVLEPGEKRRTGVEISVLEGAAELEAVCKG